VGVVLSSKLWEGRAANAGTLLGEPETKELTGPNPQPLANNVAPESRIPKLQPPPGNEIELVTGAGNPNPRANVSELFKDDEDPFQGTPPQNDDVVKNQPVVPNNPSPTINNQPAGSAPVIVPTTQQAAPTIPLTQTTPPDPTKTPVPSLDDFAKILKQNGAGGGNAGVSGVGNAQPAAQTGAGSAAAPPNTTNPVVPSFDDAALAAQKKAQETAAALNGMATQKQTLSPSDEFAKELARQKSLEQASNAGKDTAATADAALAASRQQLNNGAAAINDPAKNGLNAGGEQPKPVPNPADATPIAGQLNNGNPPMTDPGRNGFNAGGSGNSAGSGGINAPSGTGQPRFPANQADGYPGQTEAARMGAGSRGSAPVALGAPTSQGNNQYAQLTGGPSAPDNQAPPYGSKPDVSVQPMAVTMPPPAKKDNWDDRKYQSRQGDTYQSIARDQYNSDRFAEALMDYNRDYPLATDATRSNPSVIVPGQTIYLPPIRILQREYGSVIPEQSAAAPGSPASRPTVAGSPAPAIAPSLPEKRYRVRGGGAMFYTIAQNTLGNGDEWHKIYLLNPSFDPQNPVPGGTVLRMPGDAKIDPADVPAGQ
jgi:hypothetical protein